MSKQGRIIRLDTFRKEKRAQQQQQKRHRIQSGFHFAEQAMRIMQEEAVRSGHNDMPAVWYATARAAITALRRSGWTTEDLIKIVRDITRDTD